MLVVALIACQGPVGETGETGKKGDPGVDTTGTTGTTTLDSATVDTIIFTADDANAWTTETMMPIDLANVFTGGSGDRTYRVQTAINAFGQLNYDLDGAELTVSVDTVPFAGDDHGDDTVIVVEATDSSTGANEVAHVEVRLNQPPVIAEVAQALVLTVGTQPAAAPDGEDDGEEPDDYDTDDEAVCVTLNVCTVTLVVDDANNQDTMTWMWDTSSDLIAVTRSEDGDSILIMGLPNKSGSATVYMWAVDDAGVPVNVPDDPLTEMMDESLDRPADDSRREITVTVDGAPYMSSGAIGSVELTPADGETVIGYVYDPEGQLAEMDLSYTPVFQSPDGIVQISLGEVTTDQDPQGRSIIAQGVNAGSVRVTVTVHEEDPDDPDMIPTQPNQSTSHMVDITVK